MADGVDIDLYADVEQDFPQDDFNAENNDLYDDVITASSGDKDDKKAKKDTVETSPAPSGGHRHEDRRWQLYVGNLTWWTTDQDITDCIQNVGVADFLEVKFYENRANGQSKGFCCVSLASEASMRKVMDNLPKKELNGRNPVVTYATKQALHQFEAQSKTRPAQQGNQGQRGGGGGPPMGQHPISSRPPPMRPPPPGIPSRPPPGAPPPGAPPVAYRGPPPQTRGPPPTHQPPPGLPPPNMRGPPPRGPPPGLPPPGLPPHTGPPPMIGAPPPVRVPPPAGPPPVPGAHVNPAFFPPGAPPAAIPPYHDPGHGLSEPEFEEIMSRNRTVSSSAIARAVQDAANGEYASAIETLVTAISLIKQSKVASDDRCKILVSSLQDTLHGIENKSYGARGSASRHSRSPGRDSRYRSHSRHTPERYRERSPREYYRERSRSRDRERDYRREGREGRDGREREYYEDRYRERERARDSDRDRDDRREREREREREVDPRRESGSSRIKEEPRDRERVDPRREERSERERR